MRMKPLLEVLGVTEVDVAVAKSQHVDVPRHFPLFSLLAARMDQLKGKSRLESFDAPGSRDFSGQARQESFGAL